MNPSDDEIIAEIERQIATGTEFDDLVPVKARTAKNPRVVFSIRLSAEELRTISDVAQAQGASLGDFIREAAMNAARLATAPAGLATILEVKSQLDAASGSLSRFLEETTVRRRRGKGEARSA